GSLLKIFRDEINMTVSDYISSMKIKRAKSFLVSGKLSIKEISDVLGYCNYSYFIKVFKAKVGISPVDYKKRNK
ncbi:AraC family transcriptional regulator, partial [Morganella morganii]